MGEIIYKPERITNLQAIASHSFWQFSSESKMLPDSCGYLDHLAVFEDVLSLGSRVKKFFADKEKAVSDDLKKINQLARGGGIN